LMQIGVLVIFQNFILYLIVQILATILENILISYKINKIYPFLNNLNNEVLSKNELIKIRKDVNALFIAKFGNVMLNGTDNIIISSFVGIQWVGLLSNYNLVIGSIIMLLSQIISGLTGSVGNFIAKEELREVYKLFKKIDFLNFWLYGVAAICLCILLNPFIELWIGKNYLIEQNTVNVLVINFFINGMTSFLWMFRSTMGLFTKAKYRPILCSILNIFISIILGKYVGLIGVLLGTTISRLFTNLSFDPYIIYKFGLKKNMKSYYRLYCYRIILLVFIYLCLDFIKLKLFIGGVNIIGFMILMFLSILLPNIIFLLVYQKSNEFNYIKAIIKSQVNFI
ncbi:sugar translocase, partial [Clostridium perfringens]